MRLQLNGMLPAPDGRQWHIASIPGGRFTERSNPFNGILHSNRGSRFQFSTEAFCAWSLQVRPWRLCYDNYPEERAHIGQRLLRTGMAVAS
jgi:hypothetical protein